MKKICCYCEMWESGGIESFLTNIFAHMDRSDVEIVLCVSKASKSIYDCILKELNISKHVLKFSGSHSSLGRLLFGMPFFCREIKEEQYDVVHFNIYHGLTLLYAWAAKLSGVRTVIVHSHNNDLRKSKGREMKRLVHDSAKKLFASCADERWACSNSAAAFMFPEKYAEKVRVIPNGIEIGRFAFCEKMRNEIRKKLKIENSFVVGCVGRLCNQKNQTFLLDVFSKLKRKCSEAKLLLVGEGEDRGRLEKKALYLGVKDSVIFFGVTQEVQYLLWAMDVFAFPSRFEGLGIVAVEAQAAGLPIICSRNVPPEVGMTELVEFLPIEFGADVWAERLLLQKNRGRPDVSGLLRAHGYDVNDVSNIVKNAYVRRCDHEPD